jgi:hypothetical protein
MLCDRCGYQDSTINGPHTCSESDLKLAAQRQVAGQSGIAWSSGRSWAWSALTWSFLAVIVGSGLVCAVRLVAVAWEYDSVGALGDAPSAGQLSDWDSAIYFELKIDPVYAVAILVQIAVFVAWFTVVARIVKGAGATRHVLRHRTVAACWVGLVISLGVVFFPHNTPTSMPYDLASVDAALRESYGWQMIYTAVRIAMAGFLVAAIWISRGRVTKLLSERRSVAAQPDQGGR